MAARDIEERAARWLVRREEPGWTADEQAKLDAWLSESMAHKAAYWRLQHGWRAADRIGSLGLEQPARLMPLASRLMNWWKPMALAASAAAMIGVGLSQVQRNEPIAMVQARFDTPVGGQRMVALKDGSRVELNTATVVRADVSDAHREVWLDRGEAFFAVARAEGRPFVVHAGPRTVTVLGTKFSVRRDGDKVTVSVLEGRVRIDDAVNRNMVPTAIITAGDVAIARGPSTLLTARSEQRVEDALSWRTGMLTFDQATLAEVAAEFNRYNAKPIVVVDPKTAAIRIGGSFQAKNVDAFARLLRDAYRLRVTSNSENVEISS